MVYNWFMKFLFIQLSLLMSFSLQAMTISRNERAATLIDGVYLLYDKTFEHSGPKPGRSSGTMNYNAYRFYASLKPFKRSELATLKLTPVIYSFWTKEGDFKLAGKAHRITVLKDAEVNASVEIKID